MIWVGAGAGPGVVHAGGEAAVPRREPTRAGERPKVRVERPVLLHDHDDVPDPVDALRPPNPHRARDGAHLLRDTSPSTAREDCQRDHHGDQTGAHGAMVARARKCALKRATNQGTVEGNSLMWTARPWRILRACTHDSQLAPSQSRASSRPRPSS